MRVNETNPYRIAVPLLMSVVFAKIAAKYTCARTRTHTSTHASTRWHGCCIHKLFGNLNTDEFLQVIKLVKRENSIGLYLLVLFPSIQPN